MVWYSEVLSIKGNAMDEINGMIKNLRDLQKSIWDIIERGGISRREHVMSLCLWSRIEGIINEAVKKASS